MKSQVILYFSRKVFELRVGSPHKIMHIGRKEMPGELFSCRAVQLCTRRFIAITYGVRVLQVSRTSQDIILINTDRYIIVSPYSIKFPGYIRCGVPAFLVVLA